MSSSSVSIEMKALKQYFPVLLLVLLLFYKTKFRISLEMYAWNKSINQGCSLAVPYERLSSSD